VRCVGEHTGTCPKVNRSSRDSDAIVLLLRMVAYVDLYGYGPMHSWHAKR